MSKLFIETRTLDLQKGVHSYPLQFDDVAPSIPKCINLSLIDEEQYMQHIQVLGFEQISSSAITPLIEADNDYTGIQWTFGFEH